GEHLHEAERLVLLDRAADPRHRAGGDEIRLAESPHLRFGHADTTERRIDEKSVTGDAIADAPVLAVEQVGGDDLKIVVSGVRERAAPVAIAERPDAGNVGLKAVIDLDVTARIELNAGTVEPEIAGIGLSADGEQHIGGHDFRLPLRTLDPDAHAGISLGKADAFGRRANVNAFPFEDIAHGVGYIRVFAADQPRPHLDDGHLGAKAPVHLREFEADIAA